MLERPVDRPAHERTWYREADSATIDLHRTIVGAGVPAEEVWTALSNATKRLPLAGRELDGLNAEATAFVVAVHAAQHGIGAPRSLGDLRLAVDRFAYGVWEGAASLAVRLRAIEAFAVGLRLVPPGHRLASDLGLPTERRGRDASAIDHAAGNGTRLRLAHAAAWRTREGPLPVGDADPGPRLRAGHLQACRPRHPRSRVCVSVAVGVAALPGSARLARMAGRQTCRLMNVYQLHGLTICSEIALGATARTESPKDLRVRWGERRSIPDESPAGHPLALRDSVAGGCAIVETSSGPTIRFPSACDFRLSKDLRRLRVDAQPEAEPLVPILLAGTVLAAVLSLRGHGVLHASAIHEAGWTLAIVGASGQGKSTLAALFCAAGAELVSDDLLRVEIQNGRPRCYTGAAQIRLRPKAAALASLAPASTRVPTADGRVSLTVTSVSGPILDLDAVLVPSPSRTEPLSVRRLTKRDALVALLAYPRVLGWQTIEPVREHFAVCAALAESVPVFAGHDPVGPALSAGSRTLCPRSAARRAPVNVRDISAAFWALRALRVVNEMLPQGRWEALELPRVPRSPNSSVWAVEAVLRRRGAACLATAIVRQAWLAAHGSPRDLVIGVTARHGVSRRTPGSRVRIPATARSTRSCSDGLPGNADRPTEGSPRPDAVSGRRSEPRCRAGNGRGCCRAGGKSRVRGSLGPSASARA